MKQKVITLLSLIAAWCSISAAEFPDTVTTLENPEWVKIITNGNSIEVEAKGYRNGDPYRFSYSSEVTSSPQDDWEINLPFFKPYRERKKNKKSNCWLSVEWGDNFYVGGLIGLDKPAGMRGGWEIGFDNLVGLFWHTGRKAPVFSLGAGLGYRSTNFGQGMMLSQIDKRLVIVPSDEEMSSASSRLHLFRLSVPFMITQPLGCGVALRVGAILNLNTYTSATTKVKIGNKTAKQSFHSLEQRFATPDFLGSLILCDNLGVYVRWSPVSLFEEKWGPQFKAVTVGVSFVL